MAYPALLVRIRSELINNLTVTGQEWRTALARRAQRLLLVVTDVRLRAFCNRLVDTGLPESEWLESLGSLVCSLPPARWSEVDVAKFTQELTQLCLKFLRVESIAFERLQQQDPDSAMHVSITQLNGSAANRVIYTNLDDEPQIRELENRLAELLNGNPSIGFAATIRALWKVLPKESNH